jgi:heterodisulfide reductase subunit A
MNKSIGKALVVGAGISGIRCALDLAESGFHVLLIDRAPHIGGILSRLDYQFPTDRCGMCKMLPMVNRDSSSQYCLRKGLFHENIELLTNTELISVQGESGHYTAALRKKPSLVEETHCIGCGECIKVCPVEVSDDFNTGFTTRKAIYLPVPHRIPNTFVVDTDICTMCGACETACPTQAVKLSDHVRRQFRILVVDDELIVRDSLKELLKDEGYSVDMAESGSVALERLSEQKYNLMLLDIKMPGMDGVTVLKKAKETFPDLTVLMMTAYATIDTAVEAMKTGAVDYLMKPFETDALISKIGGVYSGFEISTARIVDVESVVLCCGTDFFNPADGKDTLGYNSFPNVLTGIEFERIVSGTGPCGGQLLRPSDGKRIGKIAWFQCIGSRDLQNNADFCSNICCMYAIKEALLAKTRTNGEAETVIFYMDMRTFGKSFQRYRDKAEEESGVRFENARVHSVIREDGTGNLLVRYIDIKGDIREESFDMIVLAAGQRPAKGTAGLAEITGVSLNPWGFAETVPFSLTGTSKPGITIGGSFSGQKDIGESVIHASAAAAGASRAILASGKSRIPEEPPAQASPELMREMPRVMVAVCTCGKSNPACLDTKKLSQDLKTDPAVCHVFFPERICTPEGWAELAENAGQHKPNRLLIGACIPYLYGRKLKELGKRTGLDPSLAEVIDIRTPALQHPDQYSDGNEAISAVEKLLGMGIVKLKHSEPSPVPSFPVIQRCLVVGGGIAGMKAALAVADSGTEVDLIEISGQLGGNLRWIAETIEGFSTQPFLNDTIQSVEKHPLVRVHMETKVISSFGEAGHFMTSVENSKKEVRIIEHGAVIIATGGGEPVITSFGRGTSDKIITQKEFEDKIAERSIDPASISSVVMIQCAGTREEPKNYCSRICCCVALKQALFFKKHNPEIAIYVLYRDMMSYGFTETYYTQARNAGVIFIRYTKDLKPEVDVSDSGLKVRCLEPILGENVEIAADLIILAAGVIPNLPAGLTSAFGSSCDTDGFFLEAESKWRPVDSIKEGVFACGLAHSPRNIAESVATAEAAAQRAVRILSKKLLPSGKVVAKVRHSLCSLCKQCIEACPYGARSIDTDNEKILINPVMCQGCGICATVCPNKSSVIEGFSPRQILEVIDAALYA